MDLIAILTTMEFVVETLFKFVGCGLTFGLLILVKDTLIENKNKV